MVFSSQLFLYGFAPIFFSIYYLLPERWRNPAILGASLVFYTIGAGSTVLVLLVSVIVNQYLAMRIAAAPAPLAQRLLWTGIALNVLGLVVYKYTGFVWSLAGDAVQAVGWQPLPPVPQIPLPIGISFFTFQAISYLIDIRRGDIPVARSYGEFAVYHSLFPQLVAGPIVRYREIRAEMSRRCFSDGLLAEGAYRFCLGLGKKIIIADNLGRVADTMFSLPHNELGCAHAWLGVLCYTLQIYFDFSGYSDMAIGLGRLLGFHFPENFDQPYRSANITEFWRRWHMTLSRWFRDYLYVPLGGNRRGSFRTYANLWAVFFLCGLWHGAGLTFVVWGLYHGSLLVLERLAHTHFKWRPSGIAGTVATFGLVMVGWVFFRAGTLPDAIGYLKAMCGFGAASGSFAAIGSYLSPGIVFYLAIGLVFSFAPFERLRHLQADSAGWMAARFGLSFASLVYAALLLSANSFNPFIYFRF
jgi:alginate O-acetyltransferase complex protein AlgI